MATLISAALEQHDLDESFQINRRKLSGQQVVVLDRFKVDEKTLEIVRAQFEAIRPHLLECENYTLGELLGEDFLAGLDDTESRLAILCMEHLADQAGSNLADRRGSGSHMKFLWTGR
jgi:hypothetical protein